MADFSETATDHRDQQTDHGDQQQHHERQHHVGRHHNPEKQDDKKDIAHGRNDGLGCGIGDLLAVVGKLGNQLAGAEPVVIGRRQMNVLIEQFLAQVSHDSSAYPFHAVNTDKITHHARDGHQENDTGQPQTEFGILADENPVNQRLHELDEGCLHRRVDADADDAQRKHQLVPFGVGPQAFVHDKRWASRFGHSPVPLVRSVAMERFLKPSWPATSIAVTTK